MPKNTSSESKKRNMAAFDMKNPMSKKPKVNPNITNQQVEQKPSLDSIIEDFVLKLNVQENVADLVMVTMAFLPEQVPAEFFSSYKPISDAGSLQQKRNLSKMLAMQISEAGLLSFTTTTTTATSSSNNGLSSSTEQSNSKDIKLI